MHLNRPAVETTKCVELHRLDLKTRAGKNGPKSDHRLTSVDCLDLEFGCIALRSGESTVLAEGPDKRILEPATRALDMTRQDHTNRASARRSLRPGLSAGQHHHSERKTNGV